MTFVLKKNWRIRLDYNIMEQKEIVALRFSWLVSVIFLYKRSKALFGL